MRTRWGRAETHHTGSLLGVMLFHCTTGTPPLEAPDPHLVCGTSERGPCAGDLHQKEAAAPFSTPQRDTPTGVWPMRTLVPLLTKPLTTLKHVFPSPGPCDSGGQSLLLSDPLRAPHPLPITYLSTFLHSLFPLLQEHVDICIYINRNKSWGGHWGLNTNLHKAY